MLLLANPIVLYSFQKSTSQFICGAIYMHILVLRIQAIHANIRLRQSCSEFLKKGISVDCLPRQIVIVKRFSHKKTRKLERIEGILYKKCKINAKIVYKFLKASLLKQRTRGWRQES